MWTKTKPVTCVWEITMGCNMRCKHCGSSCEFALPGELNTQEALKFVDMCADMNLEWANISGGEPFTRPDLMEIVKYFREKNICVNIISNGWLIDENYARELSKLDKVRVMISIDGPKRVHDFVRKPGSFDRLSNSLDILNKYNILTGCITTLTKQNIDILDELKLFLMSKNVTCWQVQIGLPMGNLDKNRDWILDYNQIHDIIKFCEKVSKEDNNIDIFPSDCIGYYDKRLEEILKRSFGDDNIAPWAGCHAGVYSFGLLHNGDIVGCTSIRDNKYVAGNIRERTLREIWEDDSSFSWRRRFNKSDLGSKCSKCEHAENCLGGCFNTRLTLNNTFNSDNNYCILNNL